LGGAEALRSLLLQAGFREVRIAIAILVMRFASVEAFVPGQFAATPYAGAVAALDANARTALLEDVRVALKSYTDDTGVAVPTEAHVAIARTGAGGGRRIRWPNPWPEQGAAGDSFQPRLSAGVGLISMRALLEPS